MGWGLMWLLVADARGKRKGGEKAFSTNRFHCQRWIIALLHTHFLTFYCWHWMANFPFAECLKISQNCEIKPAGKYCKNDTFWVIFQHRGCCCMPWKLWCSVKREKKWLLPEDDGLHLLGNCDHIFFWERKFFMTGIRTRHPFPIGKPKESEAPSEQVKKEWLFPIYVGDSFLTF